MLLPVQIERACLGIEDSLIWHLHAEIGIISTK